MLQRSLLYRACFMFIIITASFNVKAQDKIKRSPEEERELFGFCDKAELIRQLKISPETADRIGDIFLWSTRTKLTVAANTNDTFATPKEVDEEAVKKYKKINLSADQAKTLIEYQQNRVNNPASCAVIMLTYDQRFDTIPQPRAIQLYKTAYRKMLIDQLNINGRQADMLIEAEVWKQKESYSISTMPETDFNKVRKTVAMYEERDRKLKAIGITEQQTTDAISFFGSHPLPGKK